MRIIRSAAALALGALFLGAMAGPAFASPPGTVNNYASVTGGSLTADLAGDVTFPAVDASHSDTLAISQSTGVEVNDLTASGAGWDVTVLASDLAGPNGTSILASNVSVVGYGALVAISGVATGVTAGVDWLDGLGHQPCVCAPRRRYG